MYPIKFENLYYEKIWGGRDFSDFRNNMPDGKIGESWDIACHDNGMSVVSNGEFKGLRFDELIKKHKRELLGEASQDEFPLLVKLINSSEKLSVQVHPNDEYAKRVENSYGKTEAWYIVDAKEDAHIIVGTKNCDKNTFAKAIQEEKTEEYLNKISVKKGDFFAIDSGLVHAICEGVIIAEIQQNSDITYRIYDYGRPREIHVEKSLDVINFDLQAQNNSLAKTTDFEGYNSALLCENEYFSIERYCINTEINFTNCEDKFCILTCVDGSGVIKSANNDDVEILMGDSILIPATLKEYKIEGNATILKSCV